MQVGRVASKVVADDATSFLVPSVNILLWVFPACISSFLASQFLLPYMRILLNTSPSLPRVKPKCFRTRSV